MAAEETIERQLTASDVESKDLQVALVVQSTVRATGSKGPINPKPNPANPKPVAGFSATARTPRLIAPSDEPISRLLPTADGRYRFDPTVVIGADDRTRVTDTSSWPWSVQGHVIITFPNGSKYIGSGTMVNRHHVLTAGHVMYSAADGGWATSVQFNAAQNDSTLPFGSAWASRLISTSAWTVDGNSDWDIGMLILSSNVGDSTGYFGIVTFGDDGRLNNHNVNISGYPGDKGGQQLWTMADVIKSVGGERFVYDIDTAGGQSGSGVWSTWDGLDGDLVAGVHTTGSSSGNGATRISRP